MNIEYMKLNDNNYIVTNDDGEIVITKSNDNIKEIAHVKNAYMFHFSNFTDSKDSYLPLLSIK